MLEHCPLSAEFKKAFPKKHEQFLSTHNLTLADVEFAERHQNRITQFKQDMTDRRGRMRLDPPAPARNTVVRPVPLYRPKSVVPNGAPSPRRTYQPSSRVFTSAVSWAEPEAQIMSPAPEQTHAKKTPPNRPGSGASRPYSFDVFPRSDYAGF